MQAASGRGNSSEMCQQCARPCSLLISCPVKLGTFITCDGKQKMKPLLALQMHIQSANFSLSFFSNANVRLSFSEWTRWMSRSATLAPQHSPPLPPPLWHERSCWWESRLRHFGSSIQQAAKRNLLFKPLLVQLVWLMWQLATELPPSHICHSTIMWPWRQYGSRILENARQPSGSPADMFLHVFQTHFMISITESVFQLLHTSWRWSSSLDGCRCQKGHTGSVHWNELCCGFPLHTRFVQSFIHLWVRATTTNEWVWSQKKIKQK